MEIQEVFYDVKKDDSINTLKYIVCINKILLNIEILVFNKEVSF